MAVRAAWPTTAAVEERIAAVPPFMIDGASVSEESGVVWRLGSAENESGRRRDVRLGEGGRGVGGRL